MLMKNKKKYIYACNYQFNDRNSMPDYTQKKENVFFYIKIILKF